MRQKRISVEIDTPITPEPSDTDDEEDDHQLTFVTKVLSCSINVQPDAYQVGSLIVEIVT